MICYATEKLKYNILYNLLYTWCLLVLLADLLVNSVFIIGYLYNRYLQPDKSKTNVSFKTYPKLIDTSYYIVQIGRDSKIDVHSGRKKITDMVYYNNKLNNNCTNKVRETKNKNIIIIGQREDLHMEEKLYKIIIKIQSDGATDRLNRDDSGCTRRRTACKWRTRRARTTIWAAREASVRSFSTPADRWWGRPVRQLCAPRNLLAEHSTTVRRHTGNTRRSPRPRWLQINKNELFRQVKMKIVTRNRVRREKAYSSSTGKTVKCDDGKGAKGGTVSSLK